MPLPLNPAPKSRLSPVVRTKKQQALSGGQWGITGFFVGAVFWHFIGFWGFVGEVVFGNRPPAEDRQLAQTGPACVAIMLDRATGSVGSVNCPTQAPQLDESASSAKGDFLTQRSRLARSGRAVRLSSGAK